MVVNKHKWILKHKISFFGSLSFIYQPLKEFKLIFSLDDIFLKKGSFPHKFVDNADNLQCVAWMNSKFYFDEKINGNGFDEC